MYIKYDEFMEHIISLEKDLEKEIVKSDYNVVEMVHTKGFINGLNHAKVCATALATKGDQNNG